MNRFDVEPIELRHVDELFDALNDPRIAELMGDPDVTTREALRTRITHVTAGPTDPVVPDERWWNFVVRESVTDNVIGRLEATTYGEWGEIAYIYSPKWWGKGYATDGTRWLMNLLYANGVTELWACINPRNTPSMSLVQRLGFRERKLDPKRPIQSFDECDRVFRYNWPRQWAKPTPHEIAIACVVDGESRQFTSWSDMTALLALRLSANLTKPRRGCEAGICGACESTVNSVTQRLCQLPSSALDGAIVVTGNN